MASQMGAAQKKGFTVKFLTAIIARKIRLNYREQISSGFRDELANILME